MDLQKFDVMLKQAVTDGLVSVQENTISGMETNMFEV